MLAEAGITVEHPADGGQHGDRSRHGRAVPGASSPSGAAASIPDGNTFPYLGCTGSQNWGKYCNPAVDEALNAASKDQRRPPSARPLYAKATALWMADEPTIFLFHQKWFFGHKAGLKGFRAIPDGLMRLDGVHIERLTPCLQGCGGRACRSTCWRWSLAVTVPMHRQLYADLRTQILDGRLRAGSRAAGHRACSHRSWA